LSVWGRRGEEAAEKKKSAIGVILVRLPRNRGIFGKKREGKKGDPVKKKRREVPSLGGVKFIGRRKKDSRFNNKQREKKNRQEMKKCPKLGGCF